MRFHRLILCALVPVLAAGFVLVSGCSPSTESLDRREERDPLLKRAREAKQNGDVDGAVEWYNKALDRKPMLGRAHLEVGLLYDQHREDYVRAIYHYQRYLELRPTAQKKEYIEQLISYARISFAASLPDQPSGAIKTISMLNREIASLQKQVRGLTGRPAGPPATTGSSASGGAAAAVPPGPRPAPAQPAVQTYLVQPRDTLSKIAMRMYNDAGEWKTIYDANRNTLKTPESLRPGQTLIIPRQ